MCTCRGSTSVLTVQCTGAGASPVDSNDCTKAVQALQVWKVGTLISLLQSPAPLKTFLLAPRLSFRSSPSPLLCSVPASSLPLPVQERQHTSRAACELLWIFPFFLPLLQFAAYASNTFLPVPACSLPPIRATPPAPPVRLWQHLWVASSSISRECESLYKE